ncbi:hypothetical protein PRUPE_2G041200 [Prunus persica]|uniref:Uncharacterized protein n=1 Tax=Prunus persica TaxID=3760 RepID=M5XE50_PRUPE|nr:uncharacterized protein LOC18785888 [Prunus persica]ONI20925.1 hypothetical protein PRUPE_2G041200 [Prunus persica]
MDVLCENHMKSPPKQSKRRKSKGVKVVYISSPMKVKTSASKFRALVQELTGRDSDAERFMETKGAHYQNVHELTHEQQLKGVDHDHDHDHGLLPQLPFSNSFFEFPNCSDALFEPFSGHFELDVLRNVDQI